MWRLVNFFLLLAVSSSPAAAVFQDEVGHVDFHHALFGLPQSETTFFHRPRKDDKASLLYTAGDSGVFGAVNPSNGAIVWRRQISDNGAPITNDDGVGGGVHFRAPEDEDWVVAAHGSSVHAWSALSGRNVWTTQFDGQVRDLEIMEMTETPRKDVLALFDEEGVTVLRRIHGALGTVIWEFRNHNKDVPLQVSTNIANIHVISLHGSPGSYNLKVTALDTATGSRVNDWVVGSKGDVKTAADVMFVGANSAAPIVAWTDSSLSKLSVHILGAKGKQEISLPSGTTSVSVYAPHKLQSQPHFLVHARSASGGKAEVYHTNLKNGQIKKAYELPHLESQDAFSTSSDAGNVYFTRITEDEAIIVSSESHGVLARWALDKASNIKPVRAVSEVVKKPSSDDYAVRSAVVTVDEDWVLVRNGAKDWARPEGLSGAVAAVWADVPEDEDLAKVLEQEAHTNPISAYIHRINRHVNDLQYLPAWIQSIPRRFIDSVVGEVSSPTDGKLHRDSFGFNKIIVLATRRGRFYGVDTGNGGRIVWSTLVFPQPAGQSLDIKGIVSKEGTHSTVIASGSKGEYVEINAITGEVLSVVVPEAPLAVTSASVVEGANGPWLLSFDSEGKLLGDIPTDQVPKDTIVIRDNKDVLKGFKIVTSGEKLEKQEVWQLQALPDQHIADIATRAFHDPVASIGRVLGDRSVQYKYLNPNSITVALVNSEASTLSVRTVDTVSGQILASQEYEGVDGTKSVSCTMAENWHVCSFFGQYNLNDGTGRLVKGYQIASSDLYESAAPNDRGPLGDAANSSSLEPVDRPTAPPLPWVVSQTWVTGQPLDKMTVTQTRQGISNRQVLAYMPETHAIVGIPRMAVDPRRPVGRDPTPAEMEAEGLQRYAAALEVDPRSIVSHERDVIGVRAIVAAPAVVESTSLVVAYGVDVFATRVAPSGVFDILGKGFNKASLILTVVALFGGVVFLAPMVRSKQINRIWEAPM
ncbi:Protein of unknown function (DUF1620) [Geosmithia morbida]|uniref:ER membrane protein complex subunit 1 n=1 Tax=Geosmithia morbida TaxID=1094350 RepID=A0A9P4YW52_9HYPO|nr:Protein of unknown function (DUF1620) [Geosmithia morbida]KAF4122874.1 Protein of unknown function (DUF1620) [Geosmithia morbida]